MARKPSFDTLATGVLLLCAVVATTAVVRREFFAPRNTSGLLEPTEVTDWKSYSAGIERLGPSTAAVSILVFSDYQCPYCRQLFTTLSRLRAKYQDTIQIIHRNFPIRAIHPYARSAAIAVQCAASQDRFEAFHDYVFAHQDSIPTLNWERTAGLTGVGDLARFRTCLVSEETAQLLRRDSLAAVGLNLTGTPLVMVNGWLFEGSPTEAALTELLEKEIRRL